MHCSPTWRQAAGTEALRLLGFTLERLYVEQGGDGDLRLAEYEELGGVKGSIEAAGERALGGGRSQDPARPRRAPCSAATRASFLFWLAGIDSETGSPRGRRATLRIPARWSPLIDLLVEQRLLSTDVWKETRESHHQDGARGVAPPMGVAARLARRGACLPSATAQSVKRTSRDWAANGGDAAWLTHSGERLKAAERPAERPDLAGNLEPTDKSYLTACASRASGRCTQPPRTSDCCRSARAARIGWFGVVVSGQATGTGYWLALMRPEVLTNAQERA